MGSILMSSAFRRVAAVSAAFCLAAFLLFAFIYWQTAVFETRRIETLVEQQAATIAQSPTEQILWTVNTGIAHDLHNVAFAALFDPTGNLVAGNLRHLPWALPLDGRPYRLDAAQLDVTRSDDEPVIAVGRRLPDGRVLILGRSIDQLAEMRAVVTRALELGVIPALMLALGFGMLLGHRTNQRVKSMQVVLDSVRRGHLTERLPTRDSGRDFDRLAVSVNHMLGELERLLGELHSVGNNIAHDLRTPLSRVRAQLERARRVCATREELAQAVDRAVVGLDQASGIITALLRIAEIEHGQRGISFGSVDLNELSQEVLELYGPIAEEKGVNAVLARDQVSAVQGDRDLLFEAIANLIDNAIKFTPENGRVELALSETANGPVVRISDTGPGIAAEHRQRVFARFHRLDESRRVPGGGLGLSLVQAIVRMHGFSIEISEDPAGGCVVRLLCGPGQAGAADANAASAAVAISALAPHLLTVSPGFHGS
jgi:signal transduction histidine kinase